MKKFLVFLDGQTHIAPDFVSKIERSLQKSPDAIICSATHPRKGVSGSIIYGCQFEYKNDRVAHTFITQSTGTPFMETLMPTNHCFAMTRETFQHIGGFSDLFNPWGICEIDLGIRAWLSGRRVICDTSLMVHQTYRSEKCCDGGNIDTDFNWCVLALSLFEFGASWDLFIKPALKRHGDPLRARLLKNYPAIMKRRMELKKNIQFDLPWLWDRFNIGEMPETTPLTKKEISMRIADKRLMAG